MFISDDDRISTVTQILLSSPPNLDGFSPQVSPVQLQQRRSEGLQILLRYVRFRVANELPEQDMSPSVDDVGRSQTEINVWPLNQTQC